MLIPIRTRIRSIPGSNPFHFILNPLPSHVHNLSRVLTLNLTMATESNSKRHICPSCSKPARTCLCSRIWVRGLENKVSVTILQHSLERKHPLNSTRIATLGLKNVTVASVSDVNLEAQFVIQLLEPGPDRKGLGTLDFDQGLALRGIPNPDFENVDGLNLGSGDSEFFEFGGVINAKRRTNLDVVPDDKTEVSHENKLLKLDHHPTEAVARGNKESIITATVGKYGIISSLIHAWMSQAHPPKPNFDHIMASPLAHDTLTKGFVVKKLQKRQVREGEEFEQHQEFEIAVPPGSVLLFPSEKSVGVNEIDFEVKNLIVLDGTWAKAKRMYNENPWLKLLPHLKIDTEKMSLYSEVRHQPKAGYLSTIESIVYALKAVGDNSEGLDTLLDVFASMVGDQRQCKDERLSKALYVI